MKLTKSVLLAWVAFVLLVNTCVVYAESKDDRMQWFRDAKFGMFVHFQTQNVREFNPVDFDAK